MGKVIRINEKNLQYIEDLRQLFAKVKFMENIYWDDNRILQMALTNTILDFKKYLNEEEKEKYYKEYDKAIED